MPSKPIPALALAALLAACSTDAPDPAPATATDPAAADSATIEVPRADPSVAVRMGMVFTDTDPQLMAGAQIVRGTLRVGDHVDLLNNTGARADVRIDAIKLDASGEQVQSATAPADVFLIFTAASTGAAGTDQVLIAKDGFASYAEAKAFVEASAQAIVAP